ncbi:MAG: 2OG-Fe(II) oxygenase family protein [Gammaproteobacteria bacterium]|nr:2OG-Fe(II) oxygenase family protein [Gammaproteobacteria bacterium]
MDHNDAVTILHSWLASSDVLSIFPTLIWRFDLTSEARDTVNGRIADALKSLRPLPGDVVPAQGWQSRQELHTLQGFGDLVSYINDAVRTILRFLKIGQEAIEITGCWANVNPPGASHGMHSHPNNFLSGVYYLQAPAGADTVNFHDPRVQTGIIRPPVTELTAANADRVVVRVRSGTLLVFPAYLQHSVDANAGAEERISISFNLMFSMFAENLSKPLW